MRKQDKKQVTNNKKYTFFAINMTLNRTFVEGNWPITPGMARRFLSTNVLDLPGSPVLDVLAPLEEPAILDHGDPVEGLQGRTRAHFVHHSWKNRRRTELQTPYLYGWRGPTVREQIHPEQLHIESYWPGTFPVRSRRTEWRSPLLDLAFLWFIGASKHCCLHQNMLLWEV